MISAGVVYVTWFLLIQVRPDEAILGGLPLSSFQKLLRLLY